MFTGGFQCACLAARKGPLASMIRDPDHSATMLRVSQTSCRSQVHASAPIAPTTPPARPRLLWMDFLRGLAIALVMVTHAVTMAQQASLDVPAWLDVPATALQPFRLPMLLIISGMFLPRALSKPLGTYVTGKVRHLLWPLVLWAPLVMLAHAPDRIGEWSAWEVGPAHLWYLQTMLFCYALALLSRWVPLWVIPVALLAVRELGWSDSLAFYYYAPFFFIGTLIQPLAERLQNAPRWVGGLLALAAAIGSALHVLGSVATWSKSFFLISLVGALAMIWLAPRLRRGWTVRLLERVGRRSMVFYILHFPVIALFYRFAVPLDLPVPVLVAAGAMLAALVPFLTTRIPGHDAWFSLPQTARSRAAQAQATAQASTKA